MEISPLRKLVGMRLEFIDMNEIAVLTAALGKYEEGPFYTTQAERAIAYKMRKQINQACSDARGEG